jgi:hypothetical protein
LRWDGDGPVTPLPVGDEVGTGFISASEPTILPILGTGAGWLPAGSALTAVSDDLPPPYAGHWWDRRFLVIR